MADQYNASQRQMIENRICPGCRGRLTIVHGSLICEACYKNRNERDDRDEMEDDEHADMADDEHDDDGEDEDEDEDEGEGDDEDEDVDEDEDENPQSLYPGASARRETTTIRAHQPIVSCEGLEPLLWSGNGKLLTASAKAKILDIIKRDFDVEEPPKLGSSQTRIPNTNSTAEELEARYGRAVVALRPHTNYSKTKELQLCRRISTLLHSLANPLGEEVQCLYDKGEKTIYWSTNKEGDAVRILANGPSNEIATIKQLLEISQKKVEIFAKDYAIIGSDRYRRHLKGVQDNVKTHAIKLVAVIRNSIQGEKGKSGKPGKLKVRHAETHLLIQWERLFAINNNGKKTKKKEIYIAGIKRPCLVCYARLSTAKDRLERNNVTLHHKQRNGLLWATCAAMHGMNADEVAKLNELIELLHSEGADRLYYVNAMKKGYNRDSSSDDSSSDGSSSDGSSSDGSSSDDSSSDGSSSDDSSSDDSSSDDSSSEDSSSEDSSSEDARSKEEPRRRTHGQKRKGSEEDTDDEKSQNQSQTKSDARPKKKTRLKKSTDSDQRKKST